MSENSVKKTESNKKDSEKNLSKKRDFNKSEKSDKKVDKKDSSKRESYKKDSNKDSSKRESYKKDSNKDSSKRESYKKDSDKDSSKRDSYKKDSDKDSSKRESYKKDSNKDSSKRDSYKKDSDKDSSSFEKKYNKSDSKDYNKDYKPRERRDSKNDLKSQPKKEKSEFYLIDCIVCGENREVPFKPIKGVPAICFACKEEIDAKRWLYSDYDKLETVKKQVCKSCNQTFYAPNEAYIICDDCYKKFSKLVYADQKNLVVFNCTECGKEDFFPKKYNDKNPSELLCRECFLKKRRVNRLSKVHRKKISE
ncbi:hypothetical protein JXR93_13780 [bacterium]|nr:hypothetical protein [bacterium]